MPFDLYLMVSRSFSSRLMGGQRREPLVMNSKHRFDLTVAETLASLKLEYLRVYGRLPRIGRSGELLIIDYTPLRVTELHEMLAQLRASPAAKPAIGMPP